MSLVGSEVEETVWENWVPRRESSNIEVSSLDLLLLMQMCCKVIRSLDWAWSVKPKGTFARH